MESNQTKAAVGFSSAFAGVRADSFARRLKTSSLPLQEYFPLPQKKYDATTFLKLAVPLSCSVRTNEPQHCLSTRQRENSSKVLLYMCTYIYTYIASGLSNTCKGVWHSDYDPVSAQGWEHRLVSITRQAAAI